MFLLKIRRVPLSLLAGLLLILLAIPGGSEGANCTGDNCTPGHNSGKNGTGGIPRLEPGGIPGPTDFVQCYNCTGDVSSACASSDGAKLKGFVTNCTGGTTACVFAKFSNQVFRGCDWYGNRTYACLQQHYSQACVFKELEMGGFMAIEKKINSTKCGLVIEPEGPQGRKLAGVEDKDFEFLCACDTNLCNHSGHDSFSRGVVIAMLVVAATISKSWM